MQFYEDLNLPNKLLERHQKRFYLHVGLIESPGVDHLGAMRINDLNFLPLLQVHCLATPGWNCGGHAC